MKLSSARLTLSAVTRAFGPYWLSWPLGIGAAAFWATVLLAPPVQTDAPPAWFSPFFTATAAAIIALLALLALGGIRYGHAKSLLAAPMCGIAAIGAAACIAGLVTTLPPWVYKYLLSAGVGATVASLLTTVALGVKLSRAKDAKDRRATVAALSRHGRSARRPEPKRGA